MSDDEYLMYFCAVNRSDVVTAVGKRLFDRNSSLSSVLHAVFSHCLRLFSVYCLALCWLLHEHVFFVLQVAECLMFASLSSCATRFVVIFLAQCFNVFFLYFWVNVNDCV